MRVLRQYKHFTSDEFVNIAGLLAKMKRLELQLAHALNGKVLSKWLDPLLSGGRAFSFYEKLRSALDEDYTQEVDGQGDLFYGRFWNQIVYPDLNNSGQKEKPNALKAMFNDPAWKVFIDLFNVQLPCSAEKRAMKFAIEQIIELRFRKEVW